MSLICLLLLISTLLVGISQAQTGYPCDSTDWIYYPTTNRCFLTVNTFSDRALAEQVCQSIYVGSHLPSIHNTNENYFLSRVAAMTYGPSNQMGSFAPFWIGLYPDGLGNYSWTDGSEYDYANWNYYSSDFVYAAMTSVLRGGKWQGTIGSGASWPVVCAKPASHQCQPCSDNSWIYYAPTQRCFKEFTPAEDVQSGRQTCQMLGADLPSVHSAAENLFLARMANIASGTTGFTVYLGLQRNVSNPDQQYSWMDGSAFDYSEPLTESGQNQLAYGIFSMDQTNLGGNWTDVSDQIGHLSGQVVCAKPAEPASGC